MSLNNISEDWSDYDDKKKKSKDAQYFSCSEEWEVNYLVNKIKNVYPKLTRETIKDAIQDCCKSVKTPRPRKEFINCVLSKLDV
jgi:hypothetical protein